MKRNILVSVIAIIAAVTPVFIPSQVLAQTTTPANPGTTETEKTEEKVTGALCERIQTRLLTRINRVSELNDVHGAVYDRLLARLDKIIDNAETKSYDTTELSDARETVAAAIADYDKEVAAFTESLGTSAEVSCENPVRYGEVISTARAELKSVRDAGAAVRTAFREEVIPTLKEYKAWLQTERTGEDQ